MDIYYIILLGFAVSMDGFFAGIAYGIKKIHIPILSLAVIGAATLFYTGLAAYGSHFLVSILNSKITTTIGSLLLMSIGAVSIIKQLSIPCQSHMKNNIFLHVIEKPEQADMDHSNHLNTIEALLLGTALGIDNMVATFAAGLAESLPIYTPLMMCIIQTLLLYSGIVVSKKIISPRLKEKLAYMPGIVLILIGLFRII